MEFLPEEPYAVGAFLDVLNESFAGMCVSIRGEVSGIEERRGITYFSLKDSKEESLLSCLVFRSDFFLQGIRLEDGQEVIVEGTPNVWKPRGKLSFRVRTVRLAGEGSLKKAYDALRETLEREGIFSPERKRSLPDFPKHIALLTSREGAALGDFSANLGRHGFLVTLFDAHVEGKRAIAELAAGIRYFNRNPKQWDVLVIIRGGGSLESLEAYNSETLVRAVAESKIPTIAGIGHEKDVSLAALSADAMVSTPTAVAEMLGASWTQARERVSAYDRAIVERFRQELFDTEERLRAGSNFMQGVAARVSSRFQEAERHVERATLTFSSWIARVQKEPDALWHDQCRGYRAMLTFAANRSASLWSRVETQSPQAILARGYGILRKNSRVVRSVSDVETGEEIEALLADGSIRAKTLSTKNLI